MSAILDLLASSALAGYAGIVLSLVICGFGIPIPEDFILVSGGYLAAVGPIHWPGALVASFVGVIAGDAGIYWVGQRYGPALAQHRFLARLFPRDKIVHAETFFAKHGVKAVFFARFVVGLRAAVFFTSGYLRVPFARFVVADLLAALVSVPIWIWLGYTFHEHIDRVMAWARSAEHALTAIIVLVSAGLFARWWWRRRKRLSATDAAMAVSANGSLAAGSAGDVPAALPARPPTDEVAPLLEDASRAGTVNPDPESVEESSA